MRDLTDAEINTVHGGLAMSLPPGFDPARLLQSLGDSSLARLVSPGSFGTGPADTGGIAVMQSMQASSGALRSGGSELAG